MINLSLQLCEWLEAFRFQDHLTCMLCDTGPAAWAKGKANFTGKLVLALGCRACLLQSKGSPGQVYPLSPGTKRPDVACVTHDFEGYTFLLYDNLSCDFSAGPRECLHSPAARVVRLLRKGNVYLPAIIFRCKDHLWLMDLPGDDL